jgi:LysR family nitrogen assimilation transcriptional regulator
MELRQLQLLRNILEEKSFSRAAAKIGITQPALSRQIRALELELGTNLLYRNGRGVIATEEGRRFAAAIQPVLDDLARIKEATLTARGVPKGVLSVAMPPSVSAALAVALMRHVRATMPEVRLHLVDGYTGTIHEWVSAGRVDVAILNQSRRSSGSLRTEAFVEAHLFLLHRRDDPRIPPLLDPDGGIDLARLVDLPLLLPGPHHGMRREFEDAIARAGLVAGHVTDIDSLTAARHCMVEGLGYTISAHNAFALEIAAGLLAAAPIRNPRLLHRFVLATSAERPVSSAAVSVIRFLREEVRRQVASGALPGEIAEAQPGDPPEDHAEDQAGSGIDGAGS